MSANQLPVGGGHVHVISSVSCCQPRCHWCIGVIGASLVKFRPRFEKGGEVWESSASLSPRHSDYDTSSDSPLSLMIGTRIVCLFFVFCFFLIFWSFLLGHYCFYLFIYFCLFMMGSVFFLWEGVTFYSHKFKRENKIEKKETCIRSRWELI